MEESLREQAVGIGVDGKPVVVAFDADKAVDFLLLAHVFPELLGPGLVAYLVGIGIPEGIEGKVLRYLGHPEAHDVGGIGAIGVQVGLGGLAAQLVERPGNTSLRPINSFRKGDFGQVAFGVVFQSQGPVFFLAEQRYQVFFFHFSSS